MSVTVLYCGNGLNIQFYIYQTCLKFHLQHKSMANIVNIVNTFGHLVLELIAYLGDLLEINQKVPFVSILVIALYNQFQK